MTNINMFLGDSFVLNMLWFQVAIAFFLPAVAYGLIMVFED